MVFYKLEEQRNLFDGYLKAFEIAGRKLLLIQQAGRIYLIENKCGHFGVALEKGELTENSVICSEHGIEFDLLTGKVMNNHWDDCDPVNVFKVVLQNEMIGVEL